MSGVRLGILLAIGFSICSFCDAQAGHLDVVGAETLAKPDSAPGKRPVTVADSIQMTRLGDPQITNGGSAKGHVANFSPDGKHFIILLRKGNLETNTNDYSLILFETDEAFRSPPPQVLVSMSSSSNRPAIQNVVWMDDNDTILFLGEHPGETTQLYLYKCSSRQLQKLTDHATNLASFAVGKQGEIVFAAQKAEMLLANEESARHGIIVSTQLLSDLVTGKQGVGGSEGDEEYILFAIKAGSDSETRITTEGRVGWYSQMALSPDGLHLVIQTEATRIPDAWKEYEDELKPSSAASYAPGARTLIPQYELVDLHSGVGHLLVDAPIPLYGTSEMAWAPDSQSVVLADMYLPLTMDDTGERDRRKSHPFLVEVNVSTRNVVKISDADLKLLGWDAKTGEIVCDVGRNDSFNEKPTPKAYFRKGSDGIWTRLSMPQIPVKAEQSLLQIVVKEDMNQPPRVLAVSSVGASPSLLLDLNPQFQGLAFSRVEEITFKPSSYHEIKAGLYWPVDYISSQKYPLVIQTHGWVSERFWIDGPFTTGNAAQVLAGKGFFVLQLPDLEFTDPTPQELVAVMAMFDGAIDYLDRKQLIDRDGIGISGFSHTFWHVTYAITRPNNRFAAAAIADGNDYDYFQYMVMSNHLQSMSATIDRVNGAPPYGKGLLKWIEPSPAFNMDKIKTPLRIQTLYPMSLLYDWHWFVGLSTLGKPVEMNYLPDGVHILEKPWDRMVSQQGNVDWFCFWLKGEEDPDPAKAEQYKRWHNLRAQKDKPQGHVKTQ